LDASVNFLYTDSVYKLISFCILIVSYLTIAMLPVENCFCC